MFFNNTKFGAGNFSILRRI